MNSPLPLTALAVLAAFAAGHAQSVVPNGSFEEAGDDGNPAGWTAEAAGMATVSFARDTQVTRTGAASARLTVGPVENPSWPAFSAKVPVQPGQCYAIDTWIRTRDAERQAYVAADYLAADGNRVSFSAAGAVTGTTADWNHVSLIARVPEGAVAMAVRLILHGGGTAWFDDVTVVRDEAAEQTAARLLEPLPQALADRGTTDTGDFGRLHRLFRAAREGGSYTFGIIGGSITAGASASGMDRHYSAYVMNWLRASFPKAEWRFVNAGIGATGTNYGCLRVQRDLLAKTPDLVVSEYAVNDGNTRECAETYEGMLRAILESPRQPAVLMIFMMNRQGHNAQEWQAKLGSHYGLPMLSYRDMLWPEIEAGRLTWEDISPDEVHPNDPGHAYAGKLLASLLDRALGALPAEAGTAKVPPLPAPLLTDVYRFTRLLEAQDLEPAANSGWTYDAGNAWAKAWKATEPGSTVEFDITGEQLFVSYWRIRGPMGRARITIDGKNPTVEEAWFDQTWGGYRHMIKLPTGGPGAHRVRFELLAEKHPESAGTEFRLLCLGTAGQ